MLGDKMHRSMKAPRWSDRLRLCLEDLRQLRLYAVALAALVALTGLVALSALQSPTNEAAVFDYSHASRAVIDRTTWVAPVRPVCDVVDNEKSRSPGAAAWLQATGAPPQVQGWVDVLTPHSIIGWVCVMDAPANTVTGVSITVNDVDMSFCVERTVFRPDVARSVPACSWDSAAGSQHFGFQILIPADATSLPERSVITVQAIVMEAATGAAHRVTVPNLGRSLIVPAHSVDVANMPHAKHRQPLPLRIDDTQPQRINILMTGVGTDLTGGPLSIMRFAVMMSRAGFKMRWINVDGAGIDGTQLIAHMKKYAILQNFGEEVEYIHDGYNYNGGRADPFIAVNPNDMFMATLYFSAHIAHASAKLLQMPNFIYFIQDYEPIFFPQDSDYLEAKESYRLPHFPIFSTVFLQRHFVAEKESVFAHCESAKECDWFSWFAQPAIKPHAELDIANFPAGRVHKLIAYARPHADRNAFELTVLALSEAVRTGVFGQEGEWEFIGVGAAAEVPDQCGLGGRPTACLRMLKNMPEPAYLKLVASCDVGYSLMVSPHPSLPPFDFAAAGLVTVTNSFGTKNASSFAEVSRNIIVVEPYLTEIVDGLKQAVSRADDIASRKRFAKLDWATEWDDPRCYGPPLIERMRTWMEHTDPLW